MLRLFCFEYFSRLCRKLKPAGGAIAKFVRRLDSKASSGSILFSDVYGADAYPGDRTEKDRRVHAPDASSKFEAWDSALDFSPLQPGNNRDVPMFLAASSAGTAAVAAAPGLPAIVLTVLQFARARAWPLLMAAVLIVLWIGTGQSNSLPQPGNSDADAVADKFSRGDTPQRPPVTDAIVPSFDRLEDTGTSDARFDFAPRLGDLIDSDTTAAEPEADTAAANSVQLSSDAGLILIRNLPAGTALSAGRRISATDWALTRSDVGNVTVTLPANRRRPVKAVIEVFSMSGTQTGTLSVELREQRVRQASVSKRSRIYGPAGERLQRAMASKRAVRAAKLDAGGGPANGAGQQKSVQQNNPPPTQNAQQVFSMLPFLPGPPGSVKPTAGKSVGQEILINLGLSPTTPDLALAPKN